MYSLQMYSLKAKSVDEAKRSEATQSLREAVALHHNLDELTNADFYNLRSGPEFHAIIKQPLQ